MYYEVLTEVPEQPEQPNKQQQQDNQEELKQQRMQSRRRQPAKNWRCLDCGIHWLFVFIEWKLCNYCIRHSTLYLIIFQSQTITKSFTTFHWYNTNVNHKLEN